MKERKLNRKEKFYSEYCSGCGLCKAAQDVQYVDYNGFSYPLSLTEDQVELCEKICPVNGINYNKRQDKELWGPSYGIYKGWSLDDKIRYEAASGGVITAMACFLVETGKCDAVIQIGPSPDDPCELRLFANEKREQIISCASSRYITGITYDTILNIIDYDKEYVVIGKPCDIEALINYTKIDEKLKKCIKYTMTFFCAGAPSKNATLKLAENLGVQADQIDSVRYRGNGWPGKATVTLKDKSERHMAYIDSWNQILGRNIRKICKFCVNGVGMYADISCGDLWNLDQNQRPEFTEGKGQNIIFARSKAGRDILIEASNKGYVYLENYTKMDDLKYIQPNHFNMQTTMIGKIIGLKLCTVCGGGGDSLVPKYNIEKLFKASKGTSKIKLVRTVIGTVKRIIKGSI